MELKEAREQIDRIDRQLTDLFVERMQVAQQVAAYKREHGLPVLDRERERQVIASRTAQAGEEMATYTRVLYNTLMDLSRSYQSGKNSRNSPLPEKIREALERTPQQFPVSATVACQGVEGAYSQIACDKLFRQASITYFRTWEGVFQAVDEAGCGKRESITPAVTAWQDAAHWPVCWLTVMPTKSSWTWQKKCCRS